MASPDKLWMKTCLQLFCPSPTTLKDADKSDIDSFDLDILGITEDEELTTIEHEKATKKQRTVSDDDGISQNGKKLPKLRRGKKTQIEMITTEKPHGNTDTDATANMWEEKKESVKPSGKNNNKEKHISGGRKKPTFSDDDDHSQREKKKLKLTTEKSIAAMDDFISTIDDAVRERRIDEKKAKRLHECLQAGDWSEVAFSLLCEQIPLKRKGKGYTCRVCLVPKKGHTCQYCHTCSTPEEKYKKDDGHVCVNCPVCFEEGKKKKKLIQIKREGHICPHEPQHYAEV